MVKAGLFLLARLGPALGGTEVAAVGAAGRRILGRFVDVARAAAGPVPITVAQP